MAAARDILDRDATPATLRQLAHDGILDDDQLDSALRHIGARATANDWRRFTERTPLFAGVGLVLSGVVYFFAANWAELTRAHRLGLAIAALIIASIAAGWIGTSRLGGKVAGVAAALLVGPVLLTYGQAYQTGADAWELFAGWTVLALPFALAVRGPAIFTISLVLARVSAVLCLEQMFGYTLDRREAIPAFLALLALDTLATCIAFALNMKASARLFAAIGALTLAFPLMIVIVSDRPGDDTWGAALLLAALTIHLIGIGWGLVNKDAPLVAVLGASITAHLGVACGEVIFDDWHMQKAGLLLMGAFVLCEAGALAFLLRKALR